MRAGKKTPNPAIPPIQDRPLQREERRRADILEQCAHLLHSALDVATVTNALTERVRELFQAPIVALMMQAQGGIELRGAAAASPELLETVRRTHAEKGCRAAARMVEQAATADRLISVPVGPGDDFPDFIVGGEFMAAPIRTTRTQGALLVYSGAEGSFDEQDRSLLSAIARFGAMALSNAELYGTANSQAFELQQLLDISTALGSKRELDAFLEQFVVRAAEFLGFGRSFIALMEEDDCWLRWAAENGRGRPLRVPLQTKLAQRVLASRDVFASEDVTQEPDIEMTLAAEFAIRQCLAVPLRGADGRVLGLFGVLDRLDGSKLSPEDSRRARALGAQVAVALEATQNLSASERHRKRAEDLMGLALELSSSLRLPDFVRSFTERAADMLGAPVAALALAQGPALEIVVLHEPAPETGKDVQRRLNAALADLAKEHSEHLVSGSAATLLGSGVASALDWKDLVVARLTGADNELLGIFCLANLGRELSGAERNLLQALTGHVSVALENSRLFSRIAQSNRHWIEIFDSISDFIVVHDDTNKVLRVNQSLAHFIGVRPSELIGVSMRALVSLASDGSSQPCPFCRVGMDKADEYIHPVLERTYLVSTSRIRGALNEGAQTIHVLKDITDRREAERRYRELFDNIQEGIFFSSPEGRFIEVNDAMVRMLGYDSREELLQVEIPRELYTSPEQRSRFTRAMEELGTLRNFEDTLRRKDGTLLHTLQNAYAVRDGAGKVVQYRGVVLDITDLKTFQSQLQRERDFNSKILNNTQSLILVVDTAGLVSYGNRRCFEHGGFKREQLLGHRLMDCVAPGRRDAFAAAFEQTLAGQQVDNLEVTMAQAEGGLAHFSINLSPMRDERGEVSSVVAVMTDITDAALMQAKLMHAEKMAAVGQLVSGVAHEVNNPLTAILGFADLLLETPETPETARQNLRVIVQEAQRTKAIVQNLLSFARQMPAQRKLVQLNHILRSTVQLRSYDFSSHGVEVVERLSPELPEVVGDAHQLQQVFLNILNNAYDAVHETGQRGRIEIESALAGDHAEIRFRDSGHGIQYPDRIFDPFFTTKEVGKGTGLGLSICYGIVREHGGEITCHNNAGQAGATFTVQLPLVRPAAAMRSTAAAGVQV